MIVCDGGESLAEEVDADPDDHRTRDEAQPGIELFGNDVSREEQCDEAEREYTNRVGECDDGAEKKRMSSRAPIADKIRRHDSFSMSRRKRVQCSQRKRDR